MHLDEATARGLADGLRDSAFAVRSVEDKPYSRRPAAPFMTSTLQQEASRKLRMTAQTAMRVAQRLYENGHITYMRTDSTTLSESALNAARSQAREIYGPEYVPDVPRRYERKVKNAQEAHEAIRPSGDSFRTPGQLANEVSRDELALYDLIWKRTVASQMADARGQTVTVRLGATSADGRDAEFSTSGTVITFRGFMAAYEEGRDEDESAAARDDDRERRLPQMREGDGLSVLDLQPDGHATSPPARYTEPTLVRALEERGIGRPSTYASILGTIIDRGYVFKRGSALVPSWLAFATVGLLEKHFGSLVDYDFTAAMEEDLDRIAGGTENRVAWLRQFYFGGDDGDPGLHELVSGFGDIDAREVNSIPIGDDIVLRVGRYGPYVQRGPDGEESSQRASVPEDLAPDELTVEKAEALLAEPSGDRDLGVNPATGLPVVAKAGRYGPYVTEVLPDDAAKNAKPRTGSLLQDDVAGHRHDRRRAAAAQPAAGGRHRPRRRRGDHRAERPLRALPEEGHRLPVAGHRGADVRHHPRPGAGDLRPAQAARSPGRGPAAQGARQRPDHRPAGRGQGGPVRRLRHRRRDQRDPAQGRRRRDRDDRAGRRAAGREAGQGPGAEEAGGQEDDRQEDGRRRRAKKAAAKKSRSARRRRLPGRVRTAGWSDAARVSTRWTRNAARRHGRRARS